jgi:hypothetical protein
VLGGGVIGVEFASIFAHFGSQVTVVELLPHLISTEDEDAARELERAFTRRGITLHLGAGATAVEEGPEGLTLRFEGPRGAGEATGDVVLVATGRGASVEGLGLEQIGVEFDRHRIATDGTRRTSVPNNWQLAHTAFREGGFVKTIHETRHDELLGVVVVGLSATEIINAGVLAIDSEARVDTVGDSMAAIPHSPRRSRRPRSWASSGRCTSRQPASGRPPPPARSGGVGRGRGYAAAGWKSSIGLPAGSSSRICRPPGPLTISLRNVRPAERSRSTSRAMSSTIRWMRFQPPGSGVRPSGIGRPAELLGPLSSSRSLPRTTSANAGAALERSSKSKWRV